MRALVEKSRWMVLIAVVFSLLAAASAFVWGAAKTVYALILLFGSLGHDPAIGLSLIQLMDAFLIAAGLLIFGIGMYELFIAPLEVPDWLKIRGLQDLKSKLSGVIVLVLVVTFLEHYVVGAQPFELLASAGAATLVGGLLVVFSWAGKKD